jgi:hypothetical protein
MTKKYEHIGILPLEIPQGTRTLRVETGELFEADLTPSQEGFFLRVGLVREASASRAPATATFVREAEPIVDLPSEEE